MSDETAMTATEAAFPKDSPRANAKRFAAGFAKHTHGLVMVDTEKLESLFELCPDIQWAMSCIKWQVDSAAATIRELWEFP